MASKRGENDKPWMAADEYGRSLRGIGVAQTLVLLDGARQVYWLAFTLGRLGEQRVAWIGKQRL